MKSILFSVLISMSLGASFHASAEDYPILKTYEVAATELLNLTPTATDADMPALIAKTQTLVAFGKEIMELYTTKNPICAEQFEVFYQAMPTMDQLTVEEAHRLYHNGEGLPAAPRHCYMARSQVIHPVMNIIRFKTTMTDEDREEAIHEFEEVIEHLERVQRNLDNPPN